MKTLILGLGNELYGDDGVGHHVIRRLKRDTDLLQGSALKKGDLDLIESPLTGLALLDIITGYDALIIIDTIKKTDPVPGRIHELEENQLRHLPGPSPHYVSIPQAIDIGNRIGLKTPSEIKVIGVEAKNLYHLGEGLSEDMTVAIPRIIQKVKDVLGTEEPARPREDSNGRPSDS